VLGIWGSLFATSPEALDAVAAALLGGIRVPYLSLHGNDPVPDYAEWLTALVLAAPVECSIGTGHYPYLVEPRRFVELLVAFHASLGQEAAG